MLDRKKIINSIVLFLLLLVIFVPLHITSMSNIISKSDEIDGVEGFFIRDSRNTRFQPRQYIQMRDLDKIQILQDEENIYEELD